MGLKNFNDVKERARNLIHNDAKTTVQRLIAVLKADGLEAIHLII